MSSHTYRGAGLKTVATAARRLPTNPSVKVAESLAWLLALVPSATRSRVSANMATVLDYRGEHYSSRALKRLVRKAFVSYGRYYAEVMTLPGARRERILSAISWESGGEVLRELWERGDGVVIAIPHIGCWEWGGSLLGLTIDPLVVAVEALDPPELFEWFHHARESIGMEVEALGPSIGSRLMHHLRDGRMVGLLCDRDLSGDGVEVQLLGVTTTMPAGPAMLALRTGAALTCGVVYSGPGTSHRVKLIGPLDTSRRGTLRQDVVRLTQEIADHLSELIARHPEQWHVFAEVIGRPR